MSNEMLAGIIGAFIGAAVTGLIAWWLQRQGSRSQRSWEIALRVSETLGTILSAYAPDSIKTKEDVFKLQQTWGSKARELHLLGEDPSGGPLTQAMNDYFQALLAYIKGDMQRGELEHRRAATKNTARDMLKRYTRK